MTLRIYLGHGASGTAESMAPHVAGLRKRGFQAFALDLPKRKAEDAVPAFEALVPDEPGVVVGGHSYGGRVASLSAAAGRRRYAALVCLSYPLHPPGAVDRADPRRAHWPDIACPALFLSGEAIRSPGSTSSARRCRRCRTAASSPGRRWGTVWAPSSTRRWTTWRRSSGVWTPPDPDDYPPALT